MRSSKDARLALQQLAELQAGVVSRAQAEGHGVSARVLARLVEHGHWQRLVPGLFLTRPGAPDFEARAWAGVLLGGDNACLGGATAARLLGLSETEPEVVQVVVPHGRRVAPRAGWEFVQADRPASGAPPRTSVEDTVLDLCAAARPDDVVGWVTTAVQRRRTTSRRLLHALAGRRRHPHRALLEGLLGDVAEGAQSPIEVRYLRDVERAHGLPAGRRQAPTARRRGWRDVLYEAFGLVVELDGRLGHEGAASFRDMDRDNLALLDGLATLRFGTADLVGRPCEVAHQVGHVLSGRGWTGLVSRCPRCALVPAGEWD